MQHLFLQPRWFGLFPYSRMYQCLTVSGLRFAKDKSQQSLSHSELLKRVFSPVSPHKQASSIKSIDAPSLPLMCLIWKHPIELCDGNSVGIFGLLFEEELSFKIFSACEEKTCFACMGQCCYECNAFSVNVHPMSVSSFLYHEILLKAFSPSVGCQDVKKKTVGDMHRI